MRLKVMITYSLQDMFSEKRCVDPTSLMGQVFETLLPNRRRKSGRRCIEPP